MYKFAFIEDNQQDYRMLEEAIERFSKEEKIEFNLIRFHTGEDFLNQYKVGDFDAVFFDILLGEEHINGLETARKLFEIDPNVSILFLTNMSQYAINGYEVNAVDYIVKPIKYYDFSLKLKKLLRSLHTSEQKKVLFKVDKETIILNEDDILYIIVTSHYLSIYTANKEYIVREPLKYFEKRLSSTFARSGISYLVNIAKIDKICSNEIQINKKILPITRLYKKEFLSKVSEYMIKKAK